MALIIVLHNYTVMYVYDEYHDQILNSKHNH